jgi:uncharacterized protein YukE
MTAYAWLVTTWGKVRETLQPELFALRRELREARQEFAEADRRCKESQYATQLWRDRADQANKAANNLSKLLAQRTREVKAARAKLRSAGK